MSDDFETLVAHGKALYSGLVARSWEILVAQTDATSPAAIEATCDLQRNLVVAGAEWIALCERVLTLSGTPEAMTAALAMPSRLSDAVESTSASQAHETTFPSTRAGRSQPRARSHARTGAAPSEQPAAMLPVPEPERNGTVSRRSTNVPLNGQTAYRIFPLILDSAPAHVQLVAMSFNGAEWHPIAAWRRIYQQVIQSLQRSDPERFDTLATTLTMSNGRPLFSRDRSVYMAPIDAGGGWFATGQMPTELILQRLRMLVDWWGLPRESLSVEVMPEARAPIAAGPDTEEPLSSADNSKTPTTVPELEPSTGARIEDVPTLSEEAPAQSLAQVEPADVDTIVPTAEDGSATDASPADEVSSRGAPVAEAELIAGEALDGVALEAVAADEADASNEPSSADEARADETNMAVEDVAAATVDVTAADEAPEELHIQNVETVEAHGVEPAASVETPVAERVDGAADQAGSEETPLAEQADSTADQPSVETLVPATPIVILDSETGDTLDTIVVGAAPMPGPGEVEPQPADDPVNGTEARATETPQSAAPTPVNEIVRPPHVLHDAQPETVHPEEFTPPPTAQQSNVRWVKTINGTRPATPTGNRRLGRKVT